MEEVSKSSRPRLPMDEAAGTGGIIVAMEIVFASSLLEVTKDLGDDEVLFCYMGSWAKSLGKEIGGVVENDEELKQLTDSDFDVYIELFRIFDYHKHHDYRMYDVFFYVLKPGSLVSSWEEVFGRVRKNERYLRKEILRDAELITFLGSYDLFVCNNLGATNNREKDFIKSIIEGRVSEKLVNREEEKREYYLRAIRKTVMNYGLPQELKLVTSIPPNARERGIDGIIDYINRGDDIYVESTVEGNKILTIFSAGGGHRGTSIETDFVVEYDENKAYVVLGKVYVESIGKTYLLGVPLFKGKISQIRSVFKPICDSKLIKINIRESPKTDRGRLFAELRSEVFELSALYAKEPRVVEEKGNRRLIEVYENSTKALHIKVLKKERDHKLCDIEIEKDGSFSVKTGYNDNIEVSTKSIKGVVMRTEEFKELIEKKRNILKGGRIMSEISNKREGRKELVLEENKDLGEVDRYIASSFYEFVEKMIRDRTESGLSPNLSKNREGEKSLTEIIQTGFIQSKISRVLDSLKKIVDLCYESDGERHFVRTHDTREPEKVAYKAAFYGTGIDGEGLKGEEKRIVEVLTLISYSYPLMDRLNIERVLEQLKDLTGAVLSSERVPLDEIMVLINRINPENLRLPEGYIDEVPSSSVLFLDEGDKIKVYTKGYTYENSRYRNVRRVRIGLGDLEINVFG
jgi:hypothetical protein